MFVSRCPPHLEVHTCLLARVRARQPSGTFMYALQSSVPEQGVAATSVLTTCCTAASSILRLPAPAVAILASAK
eukprot:4167383-Pleurochrysis_carterae.AAC.2